MSVNTAYISRYIKQQDFIPYINQSFENRVCVPGFKSPNDRISCDRFRRSTGLPHQSWPAAWSSISKASFCALALQNNLFISSSLSLSAIACEMIRGDIFLGEFNVVTSIDIIKKWWLIFQGFRWTTDRLQSCNMCFGSSYKEMVEDLKILMLILTKQAMLMAVCHHVKYAKLSRNIPLHQNPDTKNNMHASDILNVRWVPIFQATGKIIIVQNYPHESSSKFMRSEVQFIGPLHPLQTAFPMVPFDPKPNFLGCCNFLPSHSWWWTSNPVWVWYFESHLREPLF